MWEGHQFSRHRRTEQAGNSSEAVKREGVKREGGSDDAFHGVCGGAHTSYSS